MTARTLDAGTLAARMNARPLPEDCDGGVWDPFDGDCGLFWCESCERAATGEVVAADCGAGIMVLCLTCALAECERAEAAGRS